MMPISVLLVPPGPRQITQTFFPNFFLLSPTIYTSLHASMPIVRSPGEREGRQSCRWIMILGRIWRDTTTCLIEMKSITGYQLEWWCVLMVHSLDVRKGECTEEEGVHEGGERILTKEGREYILGCKRRIRTA